MTKATTRLAAAALLLLAAGCATEPDPVDPPGIEAQVVEKIHDPDAVVQSPIGPLSGSWDLRLCLVGPDGEPIERCALWPIDERDWGDYAVGDKITVPDGVQFEWEEWPT